MRRASRRRVLLIAAIGLLGALIGLATWNAGILESQELSTVDARFAIRGDREPPADIVVVGIEDRTTREFGRWPFPRDVQARILRAVSAAKPRAIGYDIELREETDAGPQDLAMVDAIDASDRIVLATTAAGERPGEPALFLYAEDLRAAGIGFGHAGFDTAGTPGGVIRRVPRTLEGLPSFAVALARAATGRPVGDDGFGDGGAIIDFRGPADTVRIVPAIDVVQGRADAALRGRIVIIGTTSPRLGDTSTVPVGDAQMPGPEIQANAVATILEGVPLRDAPSWLDAVLIAGLALLGTIAALRLAGWIAMLGVVALGAAYAAAAQVAFAAGTVVDVAHPLIALLVAGLGGVVVSTFLLERERFRLRTEFARFVPPAVVDDVIERAGADQRLGGRRIYSTVMFADLRGFTTRAEHLPPETVIDVLNRYLTEMSDAVLDHGGTLVSYMGDGIMAIFGAPIEQPDHADRAVDAAREMLGTRLPAFNEWYTANGHGDPFRMGIGLVSGPVMSGNVGSQRRLEYAAVGDTTNSASRLQSLTKDTPHMVLIGDTTRAALTRVAPDLVPVGALDVRGKQVPASVWTLSAAGPGGEPGRTVGE